MSNDKWKIFLELDEDSMSRILTAVIALPILIASILVPWLQPLFVAITAAALVFGLYEFYVLARKKDMKPMLVLKIIIVLDNVFEKG